MLCTIVGAGGGLGAALARRFAKEGCQVALVARNSKTIAPIINAIKETGHDVKGFIGDASFSSSLEAAFNEIRNWAGDTDILIYNASAMIAGLASELTPERVLLEMTVNLGGAIASVGNILPAMRAQKSGTIIFTGGGLAIEPYPAWASLAAGKAALRAYSFALHKEMAAEGVHVAAIAICGIIERDGPFDPDIIADRYWKIHEERTGSFAREVVYLPKEADPFYNDDTQVYRALSYPIISSEGAS